MSAVAMISVEQQVTAAELEAKDAAFEKRVMAMRQALAVAGIEQPADTLHPWQVREAAAEHEAKRAAIYRTLPFGMPRIRSSVDAILRAEARANSN